MDRKLTDELRRMFLDGATPSELMRYIAKHHEGDPNLHFVIKDAFREAFGIPLLRNVPADQDYSPGVTHAHFNRDVVPEIVQRMCEWNTSNLDGSWLNGLKVRSLSEHAESLGTAQFEELARVWDDLNERERRFIIRKIAIINHDWDVVKTLSLLAERLQQRIVELEDQLRCENVLPTGVNGSQKASGMAPTNAGR